MNTKTTGERDYLAIILIGAGSSWARGPNKDDVVARVKRGVVADWSSLFKLKGAEATVNVVDVTGYDEVWWDDRGIHVGGDPEPSLPVERIKVAL